ncbi:arsenate reductase family protein [Paenibacillus psychroresistens]|uniref:Arsenate reductase family protein n=1 Tax=Paenibacillus psychroresistens TaxID=1778678 RepID=A0A6B8RGC1_9BACL|nr:arsenate reductase family protein [Paenibacillus psychroresistens]QGQ94987.1 arsenate reductase family protein [Paenibacillus psychroresistens]
MSLQLYGYSKCNTCRDAIKSLRAKGYELKMIELFETPPSVKQLKAWIETSGLPIQKFFNVSGEVYRDMQLKDKLASMSDEEKLALLASNGRLIKRPIAFDEHNVTVGFKEAEYVEVWGK